MAALKLCHVIDGFRDDCEKLIARFERLETVRFEGFCQIWQEMKFSLVFAGHKSSIELYEFCEDALIVAKEFFLPPLPFKERIGGLYLLYALYFKMPIKGPKIRAKIEDWRDIIEIRAEIDQAEHHDASYILAKLMSANAFVHCALDRELGLEKGYRLKAPRPRNMYSILADIKKLAGPCDLFRRIDVSSRYYSRIKASERRRSSDDNERDVQSQSLNLYDSQFGRKLLDRVAEFENMRKCANVDDSFQNTRHDRMNFDVFQRPKVPPLKKKPCASSQPVRSALGLSFDTDSSDSENEDSPSGNEDSATGNEDLSD